MVKDELGSAQDLAHNQSPSIKRGMCSQLLSSERARANLSYEDLPFKRPSVEYDGSRSPIPHEQDLELWETGNMGSGACPGGIGKGRVLQHMHDCFRRPMPVWQMVDNETKAKGTSGCSAARAGDSRALSGDDEPHVSASSSRPAIAGPEVTCSLAAPAAKESARGVGVLESPIAVRPLLEGGL